MEWFEALILGIVQGLSEFLPISSSGHLELGKVILNLDDAARNNITFAVVVHGATVLSTIVVFWKDLISIFSGLFKFQWNDSSKYVAKIAISMIPVGIVGVFFKEQVESFFTGNLLFVGSMLLITTTLLAFTYYAKQKEKDISFRDSFIIGIAQAFAVMPGISRSGSTIAIGLLLGNKKEHIAKFSFLMVLIPIIGANLKDLFSGEFTNDTSVGAFPLIVGFVSAFVTGWLACTLMVNIVKRGKLIYFAIYTFIVAIIAITISFL
ncbi:MAG: undecaprenyl-diphosphate phosphatase [Bacteroidetes bacterium]|jgi:undecaprenyl-diphosphatase|nr:undecaprenyl-diphosphate phosphatase [Bacteroidota bacterium]MBT6685373.1 undecaprenyl-diphosphate phosphatase [Bacteroidota bacterium]MBT7145047.1 undecaprenyl-diphosphate phosphatase [Bacteroidota bacterium]MBT7492732.1 undecaprenyl-diphosphate phosphatase [Bacteroidota bacterium]